MGRGEILYPTLMECKRCGQCCIEVPISVGILKDTANKVKMLDGDNSQSAEMKDRTDWFSYHHCNSRTYPDGSVMVIIPLTCMHLDCTTGETSCKIYDTRPELCKRHRCTKMGGTNGKLL